jgi:hypothetical protein
METFSRPPRHHPTQGSQRRACPSRIRRPRQSGGRLAHLAKYATKATEATGHVSSRLTRATVRAYAAHGSHSGRLVAACWRLGRPGADYRVERLPKSSRRIAYARPRRWAHMLGFGGHFSTKSRRYSTTLTSLREARITWRREHVDSRRAIDRFRDSDQETTLLLGSLAFAGIGWHTTGDALLAATAAALAREHRRAGRDEIADEDGRRLARAA